MQPLEDAARAEAAKAPACCYDAIVVLGGSIGPAVPPLRPDPQLYDSSDRVWHAARLFHRGVAPRIIVSGGSYAVAMGDAPAEQTEADGDAAVPDRARRAGRSHRERGRAR